MSKATLTDHSGLSGIAFCSSIKPPNLRNGCKITARSFSEYIRKYSQQEMGNARQLNNRLFQGIMT
jgi:hypothetical protein